MKSLFFSKQRHTSVSVQTDFGVIVFTVIAYKNIVISSMDWLYYQLSESWTFSSKLILKNIYSKNICIKN
jgi:hypothetical protein